MTSPSPRTPSPRTPATTTTDGTPVTATPAHSGLGLSAAQVAGSALAAVSGAFLASRLGVTGTLVGVAVGSVVGTVGSASYTYSLRRGRALVAVRPTPATRFGATRFGAPGPPPPGPAAMPLPPRQRTPVVVPWRRLGLATVVAALVGLGGLTLLETVSGQPVASMAGRQTGSGTTLGSVLGHASAGSTDGEPGDTGPAADPDPGSVAPSDPSTDPSDSPTDQPEPDPTTPAEPTDPAPTTPAPTPDPGGQSPVNP